jgi:HPt (histidine-containing phosphotransfer) domain-containing protein
MTAVQRIEAVTEEEALVDTTVLDGLRAVFGDAVGALLSKTRSIINERIAQAGPLAETGAAEPVARICHEIGGMAGQIGMAALSRAALALEVELKSGAVEDMPAAMAQLSRLAHDSVAALPAG